jgi:hypothetical protein
VQTSPRVLFSALVSALVLFHGDPSQAAAEPPAAGDTGTPAVPASDQAPKSLPEESFFSSVKQSLKQDAEYEVVRGHFDLGSPPHTRRYYCLVDTKTGSKESNGVLGDPVPRADGMTGIKNSYVSLYSCDKAEKEGMLVSTGYVMTGRAAASASRAPAAPMPVSPAPAAPMPMSPASPAPVTTAPVSPASMAASPAASAAAAEPDQIDIAGVKLGMSPDEVRAVLKSKKLLRYDESTETLSYLDSTKGHMQPLAGGRFVNVIAAWTPPPTSSGNPYAVDGESFEVMFTPTPGKERVMGIVRSVGYSPANAVHETALEQGLIRKYGGFDGSDGLPQSPTWRLQGAGNMQTGDPCNRRRTLGGLGGLRVTDVARENLALKNTPDELKFQIDRCGVAVVTEDHFTANGGALREDRLVTRYTVTAYSPSIALDGARTAAQLIHAAGGSAKRSEASHARDQIAPSL